MPGKKTLVALKSSDGGIVNMRMYMLITAMLAILATPAAFARDRAVPPPGAGEPAAYVRSVDDQISALRVDQSRIDRQTPGLVQASVTTSGTAVLVAAPGRGGGSMHGGAGIHRGSPMHQGSGPVYRGGGSMYGHGRYYAHPGGGHSYQSPYRGYYGQRGYYGGRYYFHGGFGYYPYGSYYYYYPYGYYPYYYPYGYYPYGYYPYGYYYGSPWYFYFSW
jgi:hypothetical protein